MRPTRQPFEMGDKLFIQDKFCKVTDVVTIHYAKENKTDYRYELDNSNEYLDLSKVSILCKMPNNSRRYDFNV